MENTLTEEGKFSPAIAHAFDQFQFIHCSFDDSVVLWKRESCRHGSFVTFHASDKALQLANLAGFHTAEPIIELFSSASAQHVSKLRDQLIRLVDFRLQRPQLTDRLLSFTPPSSRPTTQKNHRP